MLESVKIARRQSEIRQALATLAANQSPTEDETRAMEAQDAEYRTNETRYRAALIAEDGERRAAGAELETRGGREWATLCAGYELRQVALHFDEGRALTGQTAEVVNELRGRGGYRGVPLPLEALERRVGETVASGVMNPMETRPVIDRIFAASVAGRMGAQFINVGIGDTEVPVTTSAITATWAATETGDVGGPTAYETTDRPMRPSNTLGIQVKLTRKSMLQAGEALEAAIRRDIAGTLGQEMDKAAFLGTGTSGQPTGLLNISGMTSTAINLAPTFATFLAEYRAFMIANAVMNPSELRLMIRPETFAYLETAINADLQVTEYERIGRLLTAGNPTGYFPPNITITSNALAAPTGSPLAVSAVLTTSTGGVPPFFVGLWGALDMIRDPYSDAKSGGLRLTALATMDVSVSRLAQTRILTGLRLA